MEVSPKIKVNEYLSQIEFSDVEYYDDNEYNELAEILSYLITEENQKLYFSVGRYDMFYDEDLDRLNESIRERVKKNGELCEIYRQNEDNFGYAGFFVLSRLEATKLINDIFKLFYSCSIEFFKSEFNFKTFIETVKYQYNFSDHDSKRLFRSIPFNYSLFKGYGPDVVYLSYDKTINLPKNISDRIQPPPERATSFFGKLREKMFGYRWEEN